MEITYTNKSTNTIHIHAGKSPIYTQSNTWKLSGKHQYRTIQGNASQIHINTIKQFCYFWKVYYIFFYCYRKPKTTATCGEHNIHPPPTPPLAYTQTHPCSHLDCSTNPRHSMGMWFPGASKSSCLTKPRRRHGPHPNPGDEHRLADQPGPKEKNPAGGGERTWLGFF